MLFNIGLFSPGANLQTIKERRDSEVLPSRAKEDEILPKPERKGDTFARKVREGKILLQDKA